MGVIRPAVEADIPEIAALRSRVFSWRQGDTAAAREAAVQAIFFCNPFRDDALPSLVYEDDRGGLVGFLGVSGRRLRWQGGEVRAAVSSGFMVQPESRGLVGVQLIRRFFSGSQDLSLADSPNQRARELWEQLGGLTARLDSLYWIRPLRPVRYMVGQVRDGALLLGVRLLARPVATGIDALAARLPSNRFYLRAPDCEAEPLTPSALVGCLAEAGGAVALAPVYDEAALDWLLTSLRRGPQGAALRAVLLRSKSGELIGWYIRFASRHGVSEVVQMGASNEHYGDLLDHLFHSAWRDGSVAVSGRIQPMFFDTLADHACLFTREGPPVLVHSRHPALLEAIERGRAFLSRLDGEWWIIYLGFSDAGETSAKVTRG